jgi:glycosyltransferase involved in cell wall biosynthesis
LKNKFAINFFRKTNNFLFSNVDLILLQSNAFKESIDIRFHDKVRYFPNPCKFENDTKPILNSKLKQIFKKNKFYISVTGNIGISQDFDTLVEAACILQKEKNNNSIHIIIVGTGSSFIYLSRKVASLRLKNITMTGFLDKIYMPFIYTNSNALYAGLLDRKTFNQIVPYRVSSYMASGKPIIVSIGGETKKLILDAKCGFYNQPEHPISLANLFLRVSKLPRSKLESMGKNGSIYASKNFDMKSNVVRLIRLMKALS